jgi:hypothetical protein
MKLKFVKAGLFCKALLAPEEIQRAIVYGERVMGVFHLAHQL